MADDDTIKFPGGEPPDNGESNRPADVPEDAGMQARERMRLEREREQAEERRHQELLAASNKTNEYLEDMKDAYEQGKKEFRPSADSPYTIDLESEARRRGWRRETDPTPRQPRETDPTPRMRRVEPPVNSVEVPGLAARAEENLNVVVALTSTLRDNVGEMTAMLGRHVDLLDNMATGTDTLNKKREAGVNLTRGETEELMAQNEWIRAREEAQDQINDSLKTERALRAEMIRLDLYHDGKYRIGRETMNDAELMRRFREREENPDQWKQINETLTDLQARENLGGRGNTFDLAQVLKALQRGDFQGALGEAAQRIPGKTVGNLVASAERGGAELVGRGVARGGLTGGAMAAAGRFIPTLAAGFFSPAALLGAGYYGMQQFNQRADFGAAGGLDRSQSVAESFRSGRQGLGQAINPFDALSRREIQQVGRGIREAGFTGEVADAWQDAIGDVIIDTGMRGEAALAAFNTAAKELGLSAMDFRQQMRDVDEVARDSSKSVSEIVASMEEMQKLAATTGGRTSVQAAARVTQLLTPVLNRPGMAPATFSGTNFMQSPEQRAQLGMQFGGLSYAQTQSEEYIESLPKIIDNIADYFDSLFPGMPPEIVAERVVATGLGAQLLPGMNALAIQQLLERAGNAKDSFSVQRGVERQRKLMPGREARGAVSGAGRARDEAQAKERSGFLGPLKGGFGGIGGIVGDLFGSGPIGDLGRAFEGKINAGEDLAERRAYTNEIARTLIKAGVPMQQRREILRPLWNSADNEQDFQQARRGLVNRTEVVIKMHPNTKGILENPQTAAINAQYIEGRGSSYGGRRPSITP